MRASDRSGIAVVISLILASLTITPLTEDLSYLGLSWLLILLIGGVGIALRRSAIGGGTVLGAQLMVLVLYSIGVSVTLSRDGTPWFSHYPALWAAGIEHMRTQASPMAPDAGVKLIFVTVIGVLMVVTDLLVSGIHRPAWAVAPPATLFLVPALGLGTDTGVLPFLYIAIGYLAIMVAEGLNTTARWTRGLSRDSAEGYGTATPVVWRAAGYLGSLAVIGAVVLGIALPTLVLSGFGFGNGPGGNGPLQLTDPTLDLRRNLNQPDDREVIDYQTDQPGGLYLRMASLPSFSASGWTSVQIRLTNGHQLDTVPGLSNEPAQKRNTTIKVLDFGSQYLPMPYAPKSFTAAGDWRYDANSMVAVNAENRPEALNELSYSVQSVDIAPTSEELARAQVGNPADAAITSAVPRDLPLDLVKLSQQVVAGAETPAAKAAAIQAYLRSGRFIYSTQHLPGNGYQALENFLLKDHTGYCEQFASSMAMMARVAGIPSRVSVGFLPGQRTGDVWKVSIRDMHAWPELYFAGYGWVRFEPTPSSVTGSAPAWTVQTDGPSGGDPSASQSAKPTSTASSATNAPSAAPTDAPSTNGTNGTFPWGKTLVGSGIGLLALVILAAPATIRARRRTSRLSGEGMAEEQVEAAWAEIRDSVLDYGGSWPDGSPHTIGREVGTRLEPDESASMGRVATLVERARYARTFDDPTAAAELPSITSRIRKGLAEPLSPVRRFRALLLPRSLFRRPPKDPPPAP